jgi:FtsZ-binding cell division protein ZapB
MQERELNCATIGVANRTDISARATAEETSRASQMGKGRSFGRIASLTILRSLIAVGFVVALAPMPAQADEEERGRDKKFEALEAKVESLQATVSALESQIDTLQAGNTALQNEIKSLKTSNTTLQTQLAAVQSNHALLLGPFVNVDPNPEIGVIGPNIIFSGANIHIVSGSGRTDDNGIYGTPTGLGNLIIGYDEDPGTYVDSSPFDNLPLSPLKPGDRGGSHNLVIGAANRFTQAAFSGLVVGTANTINGYGASVSGGVGNTATFYGSSVSGGFSNTATDFCASVSGGSSNSSVGPYSSVSGGLGNTAGGGSGDTDGFATSVSGGSGNFANGNYSSITGGSGNTTIDLNTTVTGGTGNTAGSLVIFEAGIGSIVLGGINNNAAGRNSVVIGGQNITDNNDNSIAPKAPYP